MARKKAEEVVEEVITTEEIKEEEKPKARRTSKKVEEPKVEEPVVEEQAPDLPAVEEPKVEEQPKKAKKVVKEEPKKEELKYETGTELSVAQVADILGYDTFEPYKVRIVPSVLPVRNGPALSFRHIRDLHKGMTVVIHKVVGNWGCIGKDMWININYIEKI